MYYYLSNSIDKSETSPYSILHSETMVESYNNKFDNPDSVWNWWRNQLPPDSDGIQLVKKAILTDLINCGLLSEGLVSSPKLLELLLNFETIDPKFTSAKMYTHSGDEIQYYFFYLKDVFLDYLVDYNLSTFKGYECLGGNKELMRKNLKGGIKCEDFNTVYEKGSKLNVHLKYEKIFMKSCQVLDLLNFRYTTKPYIIISERVRSAMIENGITGVRFEPIDFELHFIDT